MVGSGVGDGVALGVGAGVATGARVAATGVLVGVGFGCAAAEQAAANSASRTVEPTDLTWCQGIPTPSPSIWRGLRHAYRPGKPIDRVKSPSETRWGHAEDHARRHGTSVCI